MDRDVIIIGSGHNGLVAAFYLARAGLSVEVLEAREIIGGACVTEELIPGFKFSTCANAACWLRPKVAEDLRLVERGVQFSAMRNRVSNCYEIQARVLPGNKPFVYWPDSDKMQAEIALHSDKDAAAWPRWNSFWQQASDVIGPYLLNPPPTLSQLTARAHEIGAEEVFNTVLTTSLADLADSFFESDVMRNHVHAPMDMGSLYDVGTGLAEALSWAMGSYSETGRPAPGGYVRGGMGSITQAMASAATEHGAVIRTQSPVKNIIAEDGSAVGVELESGESLSARIVISNADPKRTFLKLVHASDLSPEFVSRVNRIQTNIAPLKFHCALSDLPEYYAFPGSELPSIGGLIMAPDREYQESAWEDAHLGRLPRAPWMELMTPSLWDDSLAPEGKHTVSLWILFAPVNLRKGSWPERRDEMAERLLSLVDNYSPNFRSLLLDYELLTPYDLEKRVLLTDGNIHHVDMQPGQILWERPLPELAQYRGPLDNLYLCGAGMHPSGEVTGAPGHNAAHAILNDLDA